MRRRRSWQTSWLLSKLWILLVVLMETTWTLRQEPATLRQIEDQPNLTTATQLRRRNCDTVGRCSNCSGQWILGLKECNLRLLSVVCHLASATTLDVVVGGDFQVEPTSRKILSVLRWQALCSRPQIETKPPAPPSFEDALLTGV